MNLPSVMRAVVASSAGGPDVLEMQHIPMPRPSSGEILVRVAAAGVNRPDVLQRSGDYPPPPGVSAVLGLEIAGTVVELGPDVDNWRVGDQVCGLVTGGGYAEYCVANARFCLPVPRVFSMAMAGGVPETFFTVWTNVFDRGRLTRGDRFLVHGGASGIGTTAIQLGVAFGARVFTTAGSKEKCQACIGLGAEAAFNYKGGDFVDWVKDVTRGDGVDIILDMVGGSYFQRNVEALAEEGRLSQICFRLGEEAAGMIVPIDFMPAIRKRITITGSTLRPQSPDQKAAIAASLFKHVWPLMEEGKVKPVIDSIYPLERACDAHSRMEAGQNIGKIVLMVG